MTLAGAWQTPKSYLLVGLNINKLGYQRLELLRERIVETLGEKSLLTKFFKHLLFQWSEKSINRKAINYELNSLWEWLDNIGNHNFREILDILKGVIRSYHLTDEEFKKQKANKVFIWEGGDINIKRLKTAMINGYSAYYSQKMSNSYIVNLFDEGSSEFEYHFTFRLKILQCLFGKKVFIVKDLIDEFEKIFHQTYTENLKNCLSLFAVKHLLAIENFNENRSALKTMIGESVNFDHPKIISSYAYITPNGIFHLENLIYDDIYLDEMKYSTDLSGNYYKNIFKESESITYGRKINTLRFIECIKKEEEKAQNIGAELQLDNLLPEIIEKYIDIQVQETDYFKKDTQNNLIVEQVV